MFNFVCLRLIRYLHPTDGELRGLAGVPKDIMTSGKGKGKNKGNKDDYKNPNTFHIPKNLDISVSKINYSANFLL
jgi:hypothetical protein